MKENGRRSDREMRTRLTTSGLLAPSFQPLRPPPCPNLDSHRYLKMKRVMTCGEKSMKISNVNI